MWCMPCTQKEEVVVPTYDWATFLCKHFHKVPKMKVYRHFPFSLSMLGTMMLKEFSDSTPSSFQMALDEWSLTECFSAVMSYRGAL